jgi:hypothetical protein
MPTVRHARDVLGLVQRWAAAGQRGDAGLLDGDFAGVGPLRFVLTRDQWLARFPQRPGKPVPGHPGLGHRPPAVAARRMTMPPEPLEYQGHAAIAEFCLSRTWWGVQLARLVPTRANQPAPGYYLHNPTHPSRTPTG